MYKTIPKEGKDEFIEKKSLFIGYAKPVQSEEEALEFIEKISKTHHDATHNCWAYILGENMDVQRFNDDGEPSGTAGLPMIELLKREEITNIALVVTRYFGGIKLGAGGLIRAYAKGAKIAIEASTVVDMVECLILSLEYDYSFHGSIVNYLNNSKITSINDNFTDVVNKEILVKEEDYEKIRSSLIDMTSDNIGIEIREEVLRPSKDGELIIG